MQFNLEQYYNENTDKFRKLQLEMQNLFKGVTDLYAIKGRIKSYASLKEKLRRKELELCSETELLDNIGDIVGIRLVYLIGVDFLILHNHINTLCSEGVLTLCEKPKAYTYGNESDDFFKELGIVPIQKESKYTSIHYTVKLKGHGDLCCEIQVRSLFDEAWCEIDHLVNYPEKNGNRICRESLKELAGLVHQSNKLVDTIVREARL